MAFETVIGKNAAHIGVAGEQNAVEIVSFALKPVGAAVNLDQRSNRLALAKLSLHSHALINARRQEMVDDVEALLAPGPIDRGDVDNAAEQAAGIVTQESCDLDDVRGPYRHGQFAARDDIAGDRRAEILFDDLTEPVENFVHRPLRSSLDRAGAADLLL